MNSNSVNEIMRQIKENTQEREYHFSSTSKHDVLKEKRIIQILPTLAYGDAIGNTVLAIDSVLKEEGYVSEIYAITIDGRVIKENIKDYRKLILNDEDFLVYHVSIGSDLDDIFKGFKGKKIIAYHNITPAHFFQGYDAFRESICKKGLEDIKELAGYPEYCIADSNFNKQDLINMGYKCPIEVMPIIINYSDYEKEASSQIINKYNDDFVNILFAGRVVPNKKFEDIILSFYYYHKFYNVKSRLFLVGFYGEEDAYYGRLAQYVNELGLSKDVLFTGHIPFSDILAYFKSADLFLCMSEHEGFCVPLVEAMYFDIPIVAFDSTAVGETLGGSGILLKDKEPNKVAAAIDLVMTDNELKENILENQRERLKDFDDKKIKKQFLSILNRIREGAV